MSRTVIDLDDEALQAAASELGTSTADDTVNTALREVAARNRRRQALSSLQEAVANGAVDVSILNDKRAYRSGLAGDDPRRTPGGPAPNSGAGSW